MITIEGSSNLSCGESAHVPGCRYVKRAMHGTKMMTWQELREGYGRELVNLKNEGRYYFLNTLFSVSEGVMYMQVKLCSSPSFSFLPK